MTLEQQVTSLELSQKLEELGVKQESLFWWADYHQGSLRKDIHYGKYGDGVEPLGSAFTVAELGEMLPQGIQSFKGNRYHFWNKQNLPWACDAMPGTEIIKMMREQKHPQLFFADTEADARAKMLIYLLENKLITL